MRPGWGGRSRRAIPVRRRHRRGRGAEPLLLDLQRVSITPPIRHRLLTVVFLGVVTSGLSLAALVRMLSTGTTQPIQRARDSVAEETARLAQAAAAGSDRRELLGQWPRSQ